MHIVMDNGGLFVSFDKRIANSGGCFSFSSEWVFKFRYKSELPRQHWSLKQPALHVLAPVVFISASMWEVDNHANTPV